MASEEDSGGSEDSIYELNPPHELDLSELSDEEAKAFFLEGSTLLDHRQTRQELVRQKNCSAARTIPTTSEDPRSTHIRFGRD